MAEPEKTTENQTPTGQPVHTDRATPVIRTFSSDLADAVKHNEMSVIKVAMAEQKHREEAAEQFSPASATNRRYIILGFIIVVLAVGGILFAYNSKSNKTPEIIPTETKIQSLIPADATTSIEVGGQTETDVPELISSAVTNVSSTDGGIVDIYLTNSENGTKLLVSTSTFFTLIKSQIPPALLRTLSSRFMLGVVTSAGASHPFIILKTTDYETAFAAMFTWERKLYSDFYIPLSLNGGAVFDKKWADLLVENKDTRILLSDKNDVALLYSFIDEHTIVITDTVATFKEVRKRLETIRPQ